MKSTACVVIFASLYCATLIAKVQAEAIVHGKPSRPNEFPFMAALGWINNETGKEDYLCGGVLIHQRFVLTAAHCLFLDGKLPDVIKIGGNVLFSGLNENHTVKAHFIYPEYDNTQAYNDIALLQLNDMSWKRRAMLWNNSLLSEMSVTAIGYGTTQFAGQTSATLQHVDLTVTALADCQRYFKRKRKFKSGILPSHICAGDPEGLRDTCQGDSGAPLLLYDVYAIGITSVGQACSGIPPAIYTRISSFIGWIKEVIATANT